MLELPSFGHLEKTQFDEHFQWFGNFIILWLWSSFCFIVYLLNHKLQDIKYK